MTLTMFCTGNDPAWEEGGPRGRIIRIDAETEETVELTVPGFECTGLTNVTDDYLYVQRFRATEYYDAPYGEIYRMTVDGEFLGLFDKRYYVGGITLFGDTPAADTVPYESVDWLFVEGS